MKRLNPTSRAVAIDTRPMTRALQMALLAVALWLLLTNMSFAGTGTPMGDVLCEVVAMIYGNLGRGLATLAVIIVGVGALFGKVSWGMAVTVAVGISVIFNAQTIVSSLTGFADICVLP